LNIFIPGIQNAGVFIFLLLLIMEALLFACSQMCQATRETSTWEQYCSAWQLVHKTVYSVFSQKEMEVVAKKIFLCFFLGLCFPSLQGKQFQANLFDSHTDGQMCQNCWKQML